MSSEIVVPETPNWLKELEDKREKRLKARLGHEAGAGAPCLKCGEKCPGLDLHFWRKCCKICKCAKEEHEVQDDDIYGWAQFQLLGSKPNKVKKTIVLPGKNDEQELEWVPKGPNDIVDKYLKTLPSHRIPIKGSQAAQDRKQLLQKQIPVHDIDPTLCHELNEEELNKMNEYIAHIKNSSVGVGQIVSLSGLTKGNLHMLNANEAALIATMYTKNIPMSEIVKLRSHNRAELLKKPELSGQLKKMHVSDQQELLYQKHYDENNPNYISHSYDGHSNPQISQNLQNNSINHQSAFVPYRNISSASKNDNEPNHNFVPIRAESRSERLASSELHSEKIRLQNQNISSTLPNFAKTKIHDNNSLNFDISVSENGNNAKTGVYGKYPPEESIKYLRDGSKSVTHENHYENIPKTQPAFATNLHRPGNNPSDAQHLVYAEILHNSPQITDNLSGNKKHDVQNVEYVDIMHNTPAANLNNLHANSLIYNEPLMENANILKGNNKPLPNNVPRKYDISSEQKSPVVFPKNFKDLVFSTYDPANVNHEHDLAAQKDKINLQLPEDPYAANQNLIKEITQGLSKPLIGQDGLNTSGSYGRKVSDFQPSNVSIGEEYVLPSYGMSKPLMGKDGSNTPGSYGRNMSDYQPNNVSAGGEYQLPGHGVSKPLLGKDGLSNTPGNYGRKTSDYHPDNVSVGEDYGLPGHGLSKPLLGKDGLSNTPGNYGRKTSDYHPDHVSVGEDYRLPGHGLSKPLPGKDGLNTYGKDELNTSGNYGQRMSDFQPSNMSLGENYANSGHGGWEPLHGSDKLKKSGANYGEDNVNRGHGQSLNEKDRLNRSGGKQLSNLQPNNLNVEEDYLHPSQVQIGAIQDIDYYIGDIKAATHGTNDFYEDFSPENIKEILDNIKLPNCHHCKKPFEENEFAITIDRANVLFHADCFKCAGCNQVLADNVYFYHKDTDNVYCGRDYAKVLGFPRCKACDELIFTKEYCLAENATFHLKHFCCYECDTPLAGQDYLVEDEMPYCLPCFEQNKASKCSSCGRVIKPDEIGCTLNDVHFHAVDECFACKMCKKPLMGQKMLLRNQKLYCSHACFGLEQ